MKIRQERFTRKRIKNIDRRGQLKILAAGLENTPANHDLVHIRSMGLLTATTRREARVQDDDAIVAAIKKNRPEAAQQKDK